MSIYSNVTEKDLENLRKLANQQKEQRAIKIKNRILKQTHDIKLVENLSPITKKLDDINKSAVESIAPINQKLDTINDSTKRIGNIIKESNSEAIPSVLSQDTIKSLKDDHSSVKLNEDEDGNMTILNTPIKFSGGDKVRVNDNIYEFNNEIHKALSKSTFTGKSMRNYDDRRTLYNFLKDIGYTKSKFDKSNTSQTKFFTKLFNQFENIKKEEPAKLEGRGVHKIIIPSNIIDIYTRLEILLGLKLSGHTDTLTEASNLIDELYKRGEIQNKQQHRNALNKFQI